ncbi:jg14106 [Pararge aegeria aegeria]|uniref:Jg14106 protein n=1 Tax=Pararge aegeria aegeria TaxID=348720 RepID=A0A8S4RZY0_9NEOP|nr:jg14106 [Pararge aegeria aegeria]
MAMERAMLGVSQSYRHSSTSREAEVEMGRAHSSEKGWMLGSQGAVKRSVGRPPTRMSDHIKRVAGSRWIQAVQNHGIWNSLQKTYVQWTSTD